MEIVEFLRQQLDADQRVAQAACGGFTYADERWRYDGTSSLGPRVKVGSDDDDVWEREVNEAVWTCDDVQDGCPELARQWDGQGRHIANWDPSRVLREVEALRKILHEHLPEWQTVEWDHDQNGNGHALCCPRCQNAEHSTWNPPIGHAYGLPEGFVTPYVLAPCPTLRFLAAIYSHRPGYREEWRP